MKKLIIVLALVLPVAFGAPAICGTTGPLPLDTGQIAYADWAAGAFACTIGDKTFSNFAPGDAPRTTWLELQGYAAGGQSVYNVLFGMADGAFSVPFSISYDVVINVPPNVFRRVSADLADLLGNTAGQPSLVKKVYSMDATTHTVTGLLGGMTTYVGAPPVGGCSTYPCQPLSLTGSITGLHIVDTFAPNSGSANIIGNAYLQGVPEPTTMALFGAGLVALSLLRRRS